MSYADSLRQQARWVREALDPNTDPHQRIEMQDVDVDELEDAADEIDRLQGALRPFANAISMYKGFSEHQLILLSEDNPKGRRLAHLSPCHFDAAQAALPSGVNGGEE